jgi:hypothetical protein
VLVTSELARLRREPVLRCIRIHQTRARRDSTKDLFADTSHSVNDQLGFIETRVPPKSPKRRLRSLRQDDPGMEEIAMAPTATGKVSASSIEPRVGSSMLVDSVAVWVNEGGAGGEVVR